MSTNFLQHNPGEANQESDATYAADTTRTGGIVTNQALPSLWLNKVWYQSSTFVAALAAALVIKGYTVMDTSLSTLTAVLGNIMTQADMAIYALLNSPTFTGTPTAPTPVSADSSLKLATTAYVKNQNYTIGVAGGILIQYGSGGGTSVTFPEAFSSAPYVVATGVGGSVNIAGITTTGFTLNTSGVTYQWIAVGLK
jgi:hypothetical protein